MTRTKQDIDRTVSVAPMMGWTDRHDRYFLRLISPNALLYTVMLTTGALIHGKARDFLAFNEEEHPVALQLGGADPQDLAQCARMGEDEGYDEINLNCGCPSDRVQNGSFGACLMKDAQRVADCIAAMKDAVDIPVTVKTRIGVDEYDSYKFLCDFVETVGGAKPDAFIIHARKAWLNGLSPKDNRTIPPLKWEVVHQLKKDFPQEEIILNGGIKTLNDIKSNLNPSLLSLSGSTGQSQAADSEAPDPPVVSLSRRRPGPEDDNTGVDGVMIGREAYQNPYFLAEIECEIFGTPVLPDRDQIVERLIPYIELEMMNGTRLKDITRHILGLYQGLPGARQWRRTLSEEAYKPDATAELVRRAVQKRAA